MTIRTRDQFTQIESGSPDMTSKERQAGIAIACVVSACLLVAIGLGAVALAIAASEGNIAVANSGRTIGADKDWAQPAGDYANTRYSTLTQINSDNVKALTPAWTFSTAVLRGHEGAPLVVGEVMYVHTPFPNVVYALDLDHDGSILWKYEPKQDPNVIPLMCCDTVNRGVAYGDGKIFSVSGRRDARRARRENRRAGLVGEERRSFEGGDRHVGAACCQGQGARWHFRRRIRRARLSHRLRRQGRQAGLAWLFLGSRPGNAHGSDQNY